ncbi:acyltransferase family protein [Fusibacter ferrireducens]|uniref:Acyltransferase n=1 Tax=Fusibacter ferrireducens TaxID=2785058 RepID=A0ABR9ZNU6_9FIRM|nr:acyltransferase [Fusibacter ferrireducens]MBF4692143.1 acyltransferase [Fusibacter ferrireducens]
MLNNGSNAVRGNRNRGIDYFRVFLMLLVVWHHATLAYGTTGSGVLITDEDTFLGFDLIALYNDSFFMFAFFFISGLFAYKSVLKKGDKTFLKERSIRLLLPFAFGTLWINPIAHYFSLLNKNGESFSITAYFQFLISNFGKIEANHLWFLWVLFLFSGMLVVYHQIPKRFSQRHLEKYLTNSGYFTWVMILLSLVAFLPIQNFEAGGFVTIIKPFNMQVSRILIYFLYFVAGNVIGAYGIQKCFLFQEKFQKKGWLWLALSLVATVMNLGIHIIREIMEDSALKDVIVVVDQSMIVLISLFALYGFMSLFTLYSKGEHRILNVLAKEAMGIYVIHYAVATGLQYALTFVELPGLVKGVVVTASTLMISLGLIIGFKKIPVVGIVSYSSKYDKMLILVTLLMVLLLIFL